LATFPSRYTQNGVTSFLNDVAMKTIRESERISLSECKRILNKNGNNYTDNEIIEIRNWLYFISEISLSSLEENNQLKKHNDIN
jgi:hypothetical protein